jgi:solute carrier family 25 carnitine/acylcarnitine transporter 20/29
LNHFIFKSTFQIFTAGSFSGLSCLIINVPIERIKCLLQVQCNSKTKLYDGLFDCARKVYNLHGVRGVYKGFLITLCRDIPGGGAYFTAYDTSKRLLKADKT